MPLDKDKKLRRIVIDKLYNKNDHPMKQSTRSNAPTQSTPNQNKNFSKAIQNFFENFQSQCAIIYQPVKLKNHRPLKRSLQTEMNCLYQNDIKCKLRDDQPLSNMSSSMKLTRNANKSSINLHKNESRTRLPSQRQDTLIKVKENKNKSNENKFQNIKTQFLLMKMRSPAISKNTSKERIMFEDNSSLRQSSKSLKIQNLKMQIQKSTINLQKQIDQYMTKSKDIYERMIQKNAPKKQPEKYQKADRIKRIQSLKNLNQNGARKYSYYKRQL